MVDVRNVGELELGMILGVKHIALFVFFGCIDELDFMVFMVVYCVGGYWLVIVVSLFCSWGFVDVFDFFGGYTVWVFMMVVV